MTAEFLYSWLTSSALVNLVILALGSIAVLLCRQPTRRLRIIELSLAGCLFAPWLGMIPGYPRLTMSRWGDALFHRHAVSATSTSPATGQMTMPTIPRDDTSPLSDHSLPSVPSAPIPEMMQTSVYVFNVDSWIIAIYLFGVAMGIAWWLAGVVTLARIILTAQPAPLHCRELLAKIAGRRADRVRLLVSRQASQPFASAWGRAVIVLPENLCDNEQAMRWALTHEWTHVERHDFRAWFVAGLVRVLFFYQPLVWWLRGQLRLCQDYVADAQASRQAPEPEDYAEFLTVRAAAGSLHPAMVGLGMGFRKSELYRRVVMLVQNQPIEHRAPRLWNVSVTLAALVLIAAVGALSNAPQTIAEDKPSASDSPVTTTEKSANKTSTYDFSIEHFNRTTWQLQLSLDSADSMPRAVQFALIDKDTMPGFKDRIKKSYAFNLKQLDAQKDEDVKVIAHQAQITVNWDLGFQDVKGNEVYLLTPGEDNAHILSSNSKDGKKWIVTKTVRIDGKPMCWCIPIEVKIGEQIDVTLSKDNLLDLGPIYDDTMAPKSVAVTSASSMTSLAEAVRVFNARAANNPVGKDQPPLTQDEVIAAIRWALLHPNKLPVSDKTLQAVKKITDSRELPQGFELEVLTGFQPNNQMEVTKWSVRLRIPAEPSGTTCISIREVPINSRLIGEEERKVIDKWQKKWGKEGEPLNIHTEYEAERAKAIEIDRSKQKLDKQPDEEKSKSDEAAVSK